jgi:hypothetical protein
MPSSKNKNAKKNTKKKVLKGGKSCPSGSHKVCITTGQLDKLLKQVAVKKRTKTMKKKKVPKANKVVEEKKSKSVYESIFGSNEEKPKTVKEEPQIEEEESKVQEEEPQVQESPIVSTNVGDETQPKKETSFLGSIFGSNEKSETKLATTKSETPTPVAK